MTAATEGGAFIPNSSIYREVIELKETVAPLIGQVPDHERRLRRVEQRLWLAVGGGTVIGAIVGGLIQLAPIAVNRTP